MATNRKVLWAAVGLLFAVAVVYKLQSLKSQSTKVLGGVTALYDKNCAACHRNDGGGAAGPNLVDDFWIYGKNWADVEAFIAKGNEAGGMPSYGALLRPEEILQLTEYIHRMQGSNPQNPKAPQGFGYKMPSGFKDQK